MRTELRTIWSLLSFFRAHRVAVAGSIVLGILSSFAEGVGVALFIPFIQVVTDQGAGTSAGAPFLDRLWEGMFASVPADHRLELICLAILAAVLAKAILFYAHDVLLLYVDWKTGHEIRSRLAWQLLTISFRRVEQRDAGDLLNVLSGESWKASDALSVVLEVVITACTLIVYIALLLLISPSLTVLALAAMLAISVTVRIVTSRVKTLGERVTAENAVLATRMLEIVEGNKTIRTFGRERYEAGRFDVASQAVGRLCCRLGCVKALLTPIYELGAAALLVFILFISVREPAGLGSALVFIFALYRAYPKMAALDRAGVSLRSASASINAVASLLADDDRAAAAPQGRVPFTGLGQEICLDGVSFKYHAGDRFALRAVSVCIPARKTTALVGPSGAGKSTIIRLLLRLYDPDEGAIRVDGRLLQEIDLASWRNKIAVVSQDAYVFNATIRDNIAYGRLDATDEQILMAAQQANAHEFIAALPQGYRTSIGDRGVRLSTGQVQRLTLARAIVRDPEILVLDEATNAVDSISERVIQEALERFASSRTVIIIAHRFSTIEQADRIVVLERGGVREQGSLDVLLAREGLFSRLAALQRHVPAASGSAI
jgi:subfamily B ATP-binding cassette protein MsbA